MTKAVTKILLNALPIILMIILIPQIADDFILTLVYLAIIIASLIIKREKKDFLFFSFGFVVLFFSEWFFISTGVETFTRNSLFGIMPLWLPVLWGYAFVAIRRSILILDKLA